MAFAALVAASALCLF